MKEVKEQTEENPNSFLSFFPPLLPREEGGERKGGGVSVGGPKVSGWEGEGGWLIWIILRVILQIVMLLGLREGPVRLTFFFIFFFFIFFSIFFSILFYLIPSQNNRFVAQRIAQNIKEERQKNALFVVVFLQNISI